LLVLLEGAVPDAYSVRFEVAGDDPVVFSCTIQMCEGRAVLERAVPGVTIVVVDGEGSELVRETHSPQYRRVQPNGRGCPPECLVTELTIHLPEAQEG
jgi:hypothetical protein